MTDSIIRYSAFGTFCRAGSAYSFIGPYHYILERYFAAPGYFNGGIQNHGGTEKSSITTYPLKANGTDAAIMDRIIILKFFLPPAPGAPFAMNDQNLSPSMYTTGLDHKATSWRATVVLPAPTGPESIMMNFLSSVGLALAVHFLTLKINSYLFKAYLINH